MSLPPFVTGTEAGSAVIRGYCRWHIWPAVTETLILDGPGTTTLLLPTLALTAVTAVTETRWGRGQTAVTLTPATDLDWSAAGVLWHVDRKCWTSKPRGISVSIVHGYADVPDDIAQLATALTARSAGNPSRVKRMQLGQRSVEYAAAGLLLDEIAVLDRYRRLI